MVQSDILGGQHRLPLALLRRTALNRNRNFVKSLSSQLGVSFAPHAKTTMSPELIREQMADGAWGMTAATVEQAERLLSWGVPNILLANQVTDEAGIRGLAALNERHCEILVLVDSIEGVIALERGFQGRRPVGVLIEIGDQDGRAGVRSTAAAMMLAHRVAASPALSLRGIEAFENVFRGSVEESDQKVEKLFDRIAEVVTLCDNQRCFDRERPILSAGGSTYYDRAVQRLKDMSPARGADIIIRAGCTVTHDHGMVAEAYRRIQQRSGASLPLREKPEAALEIWCSVQSRPEPTLAIVGAGKRDLSFDMHLPVPVRHRRAGEMTPAPQEWRIERLNDHHGFMRIPAEADLVVGDLVGLGVSHPCMTFDRWRRLWVVDDDYVAVGEARTYFRPED